MSNPNSSVKYPTTTPPNITTDFRKVVIESSTPNDTRINFDLNQKSLVSKIVPMRYNDPSYPYNFPAYNKPNTDTYPNDIIFSKMITPDFDIVVEKIKVCIHSPTTYGCVKLNVWDFGDSLENVPVNLIGMEEGEGSEENVPLTIFPDVSLISNALDPLDDYFNMESNDSVEIINQTPKLSPFNYIINAKSILSLGVQYAEGNAYGIKVYIVGWALQSDGGTGLLPVEDDPDYIDPQSSSSSSSESEGSSPPASGSSSPPASGSSGGGGEPPASATFSFETSDKLDVDIYNTSELVTYPDITGINNIFPIGERLMLFKIIRSDGGDYTPSITLNGDTMLMKSVTTPAPWGPGHPEAYSDYYYVSNVILPVGANTVNISASGEGATESDRDYTYTVVNF